MSAQVLLDPVLQKCGPTLYHAAGAAIEPLKNLVASTAHDITIRVVGEQTLAQKVGWFILGGVTVGAVGGAAAYGLGRVHENSRMKKYAEQRDKDRGLEGNQRTYVRGRAEINEEQS